LLDVLDEKQLALEIADRASACSVLLTSDASLRIARHMRRVLEAEPSLHLTSISDPRECLERHIGESIEGAALLDPDVAGDMLDLGSGNGYPGLRPHLAETSRRKAAFLRTVIEESFPNGKVIEKQIQRAVDLADEPSFVVVATRAMGNWERVLPRLASRMTAGARLLVWAGEQMEAVSSRTAWRRFRRVERRPIPGRDRSWIWSFEPAGTADQHF
jgi:16S rRNA G527 N7-methylase RsmG